MNSGFSANVLPGLLVFGWKDPRVSMIRLICLFISALCPVGMSPLVFADAQAILKSFKWTPIPKPAIRTPKKIRRVFY